MAEELTAPTPRATVITDRAVALVIVSVTAVFFVLTFGEVSAFARASAGRGPYFFPRVVLILLLIVETVLLFSVFSPRHPMVSRRLPSLRMGLLIAATAAYCALIPLAGFLISSVIFGIFVPLLLGRRDYGVIIAVALVYSTAVWWLFERVFLIILPASPFDIGF